MTDNGQDALAALLKQARLLGRNVGRAQLNADQHAQVLDAFATGLKKGSRTPTAPSSITRSSKLSELMLTRRSYNRLNDFGIGTIDQLMAFRGEDLLLEIRGFGTGCLDEVTRKLAAAGLKLRE